MKISIRNTEELLPNSRLKLQIRPLFTMTWKQSYMKNVQVIYCSK